MDVESLRVDLAKHGQEHLLQFWPQLTPNQKLELYEDLKCIDVEEVTGIYRSCTGNGRKEKLDHLLQPIPSDLHGGVATSSPEMLKAYREEGLRQVAEGRVAALLLAGGQGTRLGVPYPKGMYNVGLPSGKTMYQIQGERLIRLEKMAADLTGKKGHIPWYIMTSEHTKEPTVEFFENHDYFGLKKENLVVFEQYMLPCFTLDGKIILQNPWTVAKAPDGNGGLFQALRKRGILDDMERRGIKYVHVYCVDNILVKVADPVFTGYCITKGANCAAKVVEKVIPTESVGVVCRVDGKYQVVEYSEISLDTAQMRNPDGKLTFRAGNICNHFFTLDFLQSVANGKRLRHHTAVKKIPYVNNEGQIVKPTKSNGIKLEKFVFDVFEFSERFAAWEVLRENEFSPLKNADTAEKDTPTTCRLALSDLHRRYVEAAGGKFREGVSLKIDIGPANGEINGNTNHLENDHSPPVDRKKKGVVTCEISPLVSYDGEALDKLVSGKVFESALVLYHDNERHYHQDTNGNRND